MSIETITRIDGASGSEPMAVVNDIDTVFIGQYAVDTEQSLLEQATIKDRSLLKELRRRIKPDRYTIKDIDGARYYFRNSQLAEAVESIDTLSGIDALESLLQQNGALAIPVHHTEIQGAGMPPTDVTIVRASENGAEIMTESCWIRDPSQIVMAYMKLWNYDKDRYTSEAEKGKELLTSLLTLMSTPKQLERMSQVIQHKADKTYVDDASHWPYIYFDGDNLSGEKSQDWSQKQDGWQMLAYATFEALENKFIQESDLTDSHRQFLSSITSFLDAIGYWDQENAGSWEEISAVRTSVVSWEVAVLSKIAQHLEKNDISFLSKGIQDVTGRNEHDVSTWVQELFEKGLNRVRKQIPYESPDYDTGDVRYREGDATLAYLLDLEMPQMIDTELEDKVLDQIETLTDAATNYGIIRYVNDPYERRGYWSYRVKELLRQKLGRGLNSVYPEPDSFSGRCDILPEGEEASWTHVNFQLSVWAGERYKTTNNTKYRVLQKKYLMRGLSMITGDQEVTLVHDGENIEVKEIPAFRVPEVIYTTPLDENSTETTTVPGPFTPLNWGAALLHKAVVTYRETTELSN